MELTFDKVSSSGQIIAVSELAEQIWTEYYERLIAVGQIRYMLDRFQSAAAISRQIKDDHYEYYEMNVDGRLIGYMSVKEADGKLFLSKFYVHRNHRGQGYASVAMRWLIRLCRERRLSAIWLTVNRHNETALAVYAKKGFRKLRAEVADIGGGFVMDDYIMELAIAQEE